MNRPVSHLGAILFAIAGFSAWVLCDSAIKFAGRSRLPNYEIVAFLGFLMAMFIFTYTLFNGTARELWPKRPKRLVIRSCLDAGNNLFVVVALRHLSLTLFYILVFTSPMLVAFLGRVFLNERLDWRKVVAILTGFLGVVVAVYPSRSGGNNAWVGFAACAICVTCFSSGIVWAREISQTEMPETITFFSGLVSGVIGLVGMLVHAVALDMRLAVALLIMSLLGAVGNICTFTALKYAEAATVSQYHYSQLLVGAIVGYYLFHETPTVWMLAGALLIIAAGIYIAVRREPLAE